MFKIYSSERCLVLSLSNGSVTYDQIPIARYRSFYPVTTVASFAYDNGFTLHGVRSLTCVHSSSWYSYDTQQFNELPRCVLTGETDLIQSHKFSFISLKINKIYNRIIFFSESVVQNTVWLWTYPMEVSHTANFQQLNSIL